MSRSIVIVGGGFAGARSPATSNAGYRGTGRSSSLARKTS